MADVKVDGWLVAGWADYSASTQVALTVVELVVWKVELLFLKSDLVMDEKMAGK